MILQNLGYTSQRKTQNDSALDGQRNVSLPYLVYLTLSIISYGSDLLNSVLQLIFHPMVTKLLPTTKRPASKFMIPIHTSR